MAELTQEEADQLAALQAKQEAPDEEPKGDGTSRVLNIGIDLGDDAQVQRAFDLGLLTKPELEELEDDGAGEGGGGGGDEEGPKRRGFFPDS